MDRPTSRMLAGICALALLVPVVAASGAVPRFSGGLDEEALVLPYPLDVPCYHDDDGTWVAVGLPFLSETCVDNGGPWWRGHTIDIAASDDTGLPVGLYLRFENKAGDQIYAESFAVCGEGQAYAPPGWARLRFMYDPLVCRGPSAMTEGTIVATFNAGA